MDELCQAVLHVTIQDEWHHSKIHADAHATAMPIYTPEWGNSVVSYSILQITRVWWLDIEVCVICSAYIVCDLIRVEEWIGFGITAAKPNQSFNDVCH